MLLEFSLARRYLRLPGGLTWITARLAVVGIAVGVAAMIFAFALSNGFREEVQEKLLGSTAHINVSRADGGEIADAAEIAGELRKIDGVTIAAPSTYESALLTTKESNTYAVLRGHADLPSAALADGCVEASFGSELVKKAGLNVGGRVRAIFGIQNEGEPQKLCLIVKETFTTGLYDHDSAWINLSLRDLNYITGIGPTMIEIKVNDVYRSRLIAQAVHEKLGVEYKVLDWQEVNRPFFAALSFERQIVLIIISLVILLSLLNITFTLALGVTQRRQDIAVLRTAGAKTSKIISIFIVEGMLLGTAGIIAGVLLGLSACFLMNHFRLISLPADVYVLNTITLRPDIVTVLLISFFAFLLCLLATAYPAIAAARIKPWENLRQ